MVDREIIRSFLTNLYAPDDEVELVAVKDGVARRKTFTVDFLASEFDGYQAFENDGWNVYVSVLPIGEQARERYDRLWIDVDDSSVAYQDVMAKMPGPSTLVETSPGRWQAIWLLAAPVPATRGKSLVRRIAQAYGGDSAVHDPRRVLRVPGIRNAKRNVDTKLLDTGFNRADLDEFDIPEGVEEVVTMATLQAVAINDPKKVLGEWLGGCDEGDRARKAYVTARFLRNCGVSYDDALIIINTGAQRATPPLSEREVVHSTTSAYNRQDG